MMRSFLTRLVSSAPRSLVLIPCLLVCLACATPFPVENLEEGMTPLEVRESVGEPRFIAPNGVWIYTHEEQEWVFTFFPLTPLFIPLFAGLPDASWDEMYVIKGDVFLHFNDGKLWRWQVTEPPPAVSSGIWDDPFPSPTFSFPSKKDIKHHKKGHKHHHGHGC